MITTWLATLEQRHLADLTFQEVARALRALSSTYVERRERLATRGALDSAGKRAAYALYYSPLHLLTVERIVEALNLADRPIRHILDLGCGGGAAGAAWAALAPPAIVTGIDRHQWMLAEATLTYRSFGVVGNARRADAAHVRVPHPVDAAVAGWMVNELNAIDRGRLKSELLIAAARGVRVLIVEPISTRVTPWWSEWAQDCVAAGGRADTWRFRVELPSLVQRLGHAAGLRHDELTARSISIG